MSTAGRGKDAFPEHPRLPLVTITKGLYSDFNILLPDQRLQLNYEDEHELGYTIATAGSHQTLIIK